MRIELELVHGVSVGLDCSLVRVYEQGCSVERAKRHFLDGVWIVLSVFRTVGGYYCAHVGTLIVYRRKIHAQPADS